MMKKVFFSILIALVFLTLGFAFWWQKTRTFSKEVLKFEILGPEKIELAKEVEYLVRFKNQGDINLEQAKLIFEFPENSLVLEGKRRQIKEIGTIYPGQEKTISFFCRLLGKEGERKIARAWLRYRPKNLKSFFESSTTKTTIISFVPLNLQINIPKRIIPQKEINFSLNYFSNVDYPLSDLRILIDYPQGFEFLSALPPSPFKNEWEIGLLNKTEGGKIEISGKFSGKIGEKKFLKAQIGLWQKHNFILLKEVTKGIEIVAPHIYLSQEINGSPDYIASPGENLHYEIFFKNIGEKPLTNLFLVIKLEGKAFDFDSIKVLHGKFKKGNNSLIFESKDIPSLSFLDSQSEGKVEFWIDLKKEWEILGQKDKNAFLKTTVLLSQAREEFLTKVNSKLEIESLSFYEDEIFENEGPFPPQVGKETTFTIIWRAKNYFNDLENVKVKAILPQNVKLTGKIFPKEAKLTFDSESRQILWEIDKMKAGTGIIFEEKNVAFQVALKMDKKEKKVQILGETEIQGEDTWTRKTIKAKAKALELSFEEGSQKQNDSKF